MRKLLIVMAVVFALSVVAAALAQAATTSTKMPSKSKTTMKAKCPTMHKASAMHKHKMSAMHKRWKSAKHHRVSTPAKRGAGAMSKKLKCHKVSTWHCPKKHAVRRAARPAQAARGPVVNCPSPVVNVPQQPAPIVNVPQQPAPVVNVPASPPTVGITVDNCSIFIVRENTLTVLDKNTYEVKKTMTLQ